MDNTENSSVILRKRTIKKAIVIFIALMVFLIFFSNTINNISLPKVRTDYLKRGSLAHEIDGEGIVAAADTYAMYCPSDGKVLSVDVSEGAQVKYGQQIMSFDTSSLKVQLADETDSLSKLQNNMEKMKNSISKAALTAMDGEIKAAKCDMDEKIKNLDTEKKLYDAGAEPRVNVDKAQSDLNAAEQKYNEALRSKEKSIGDVNIDIENMKKDIDIQARKVQDIKDKISKMEVVKAPCDGKITGLTAKAGYMAEGGKLLFNISDISKGFIISIPVDIGKAVYAAAGDSATVTIKASSAGKVEGVVQKIIDDPEKKDSKKDIIISVKGEGLKGGETAEAVIQKKTDSDLLIIPNSAVNYDSQQRYVYVVRKQKGPLGMEYYAQKAKIMPADSDDSNTAVSDGVNEAEDIIVSTDRPLSDGCRVNITGGE